MPSCPGGGRFRRVALLAAALAACAAPRSAEIVREGRAVACIELAADAHPLEKEAAQDLVWAVREATGATLEVVPLGSVPAGLVPIRFVHEARPVPRGAFKGRRWLYDESTVQAGADGVVIGSFSPAGAANGVATILAEDLGVRLYYPERMFAIVPPAPGGTVRVREHFARPDFEYRLWSESTGREAGLYRRLNRLTDSRVPVPKYGFGHNLATFLNPSAMGKEHPEYFAFYKGGRPLHGSNAADADHPCFTHPDVVRIAADAARQFFAANPGRDTFSLCMNDNPRFCECDRCGAVDRPYRDLPVGRQYSESYYDWVSKVAEDLARTDPDPGPPAGRNVGVYAYWSVEQPPRNRERLPDNVIVALTQDVLQWRDPAYRAKDDALVKAWAGRTWNLHKYVYYGLGWYTPRTSPRLVAEDLRASRAANVQACYAEAYPFWAWAGPMLYVAARLQWDVNDDVDRILDEFHRDCFGDAAGAMRAYHDACERYWTKARPGRWFEGLDRLEPEEAMADVAVLKEADGHLAAALARASDAKVRERIAWIRSGWDFTMAVANAFSAKRTLAAGADEGRLRTFVACALEVERTREWLAGEPAYAHSYYARGDRFDGKCWGWFRKPVLDGAAAVRKSLAEAHPAAEAAARWASLVEESGLGALAKRRGWTLD